jgi:hypothetical protein
VTGGSTPLRELSRTARSFPPAMTRSMLPMAFAVVFVAFVLTLLVAAAAAHGGLACPAGVDGFVDGVASSVEVAVERLLHGDPRGALEAVLA